MSAVYDYIDSITMVCIYVVIPLVPFGIGVGLVSRHTDWQVSRWNSFIRDCALFTSKYAPMIGLINLLWGIIVAFYQMSFIIARLNLSNDLAYYVQVDLPQYKAVQTISNAIANTAFSLETKGVSASVSSLSATSFFLETFPDQFGDPDDLTSAAVLRSKSTSAAVGEQHFKWAPMHFGLSSEDSSSPSSSINFPEKSDLLAGIETETVYFDRERWPQSKLNRKQPEHSLGRRLQQNGIITFVYHTDSFENMLTDANLVDVCMTERNIISNITCIDSGNYRSSIVNAFATPLSSCEYYTTFSDSLPAFGLAQNKQYVAENTEKVNPASKILVSYFEVGTCGDSGEYEDGEDFINALSNNAVGNVRVSIVDDKYLTQEYDTAFNDTMLLAAVAFCASFLLLTILIRGIFMAIVTVLSVLIALTNAAALMTAFDYEYLSSLNIFGCFVVVVLSSNTLVLFAAAWRNAVEPGIPATVSDIIETYAPIGRPLLFTTCAACIALFSLTASPVLVAHQLGAFTGLAVALFYVNFHYIILPLWVYTSWFALPKVFHFWLERKQVQMMERCHGLIEFIDCCTHICFSDPDAEREREEMAIATFISRSHRGDGAGGGGGGGMRPGTGRSGDSTEDRPRTARPVDVSEASSEVDGDDASERPQIVPTENVQYDWRVGIPEYDRNARRASRGGRSSVADGESHYSDGEGSQFSDARTTTTVAVEAVPLPGDSSRRNPRRAGRGLRSRISSMFGASGSRRESNGAAPAIPMSASEDSARPDRNTAADDASTATDTQGGNNRGGGDGGPAVDSSGNSVVTASTAGGREGAGEANSMAENSVVGGDGTVAGIEHEGGDAAESGGRRRAAEGSAARARRGSRGRRGQGGREPAVVEGGIYLDGVTEEGGQGSRAGDGCCDDFHCCDDNDWQDLHDCFCEGKRPLKLFGFLMFLIGCFCALLIIFFGVNRYEQDFGLQQLFYPNGDSIGDALTIMREFKSDLLTAPNLDTIPINVLTVAPTRAPSQAPTRAPTTARRNLQVQAPSFSPTADPLGDFPHIDYTMTGCWGLSTLQGSRDSTPIAGYDTRRFALYVDDPAGLESDLSTLCSYVQANREYLSIHPDWSLNVDCIYQQYLRAEQSAFVQSLPAAQRTTSNALLYWGWSSDVNSNLMGAVVNEGVSGVKQPTTAFFTPVWLCSNFTLRTYVSEITDDPGLADDIRDRWEQTFATYGASGTAVWGVSTLIATPEFTYPLLEADLAESVLLSLVLSIFGLFCLLLTFTGLDLFLSLLTFVGMFTILILAVCLHVYFQSRTLDFFDFIVVIALFAMVGDMPMHFITYYVTARATADTKDLTVMERSPSPALAATNQYVRWAFLFPVFFACITALPLLDTKFEIMRKGGEFIIIIALSTYVFTVLLLPYMVALACRTYFYERCCLSGAFCERISECLTCTGACTCICSGADDDSEYDYVTAQQGRMVREAQYSVNMRRRSHPPTVSRSYSDDAAQHSRGSRRPRSAAFGESSGSSGYEGHVLTVDSEGGGLGLYPERGRDRDMGRTNSAIAFSHSNRSTNSARPEVRDVYTGARSDELLDPVAEVEMARFSANFSNYRLQQQHPPLPPISMQMQRGGNASMYRVPSIAATQMYHHPSAVPPHMVQDDSGHSFHSRAAPMGPPPPGSEYYGGPVRRGGGEYVYEREPLPMRGGSVYGGYPPEYSGPQRPIQHVRSNSYTDVASSYHQIPPPPPPPPPPHPGYYPHPQQQYDYYDRDQDNHSVGSRTARSAPYYPTPPSAMAGGSVYGGTYPSPGTVHGGGVYGYPLPPTPYGQHPPPHYYGPASDGGGGYPPPGY